MRRFRCVFLGLLFSSVAASLPISPSKLSIRNRPPCPARRLPLCVATDTRFSQRRPHRPKAQVDISITRRRPYQIQGSRPRLRCRDVDVSSQTEVTVKLRLAPLGNRGCQRNPNSCARRGRRRRRRRAHRIATLDHATRRRRRRRAFSARRRRQHFRTARRNLLSVRSRRRIQLQQSDRRWSHRQRTRWHL